MTEALGDHGLAKQATIALYELYQWALLNKSTSLFGQNELSSLEKKKYNKLFSACKVTYEIIDLHIAIRDEAPRLNSLTLTFSPR